VLSNSYGLLCGVANFPAVAGFHLVAASLGGSSVCSVVCSRDNGASKESISLYVWAASVKRGLLWVVTHCTVQKF
jgi:hypothetical protein